jgi:transcription antitermination protein NusB
MLNARRAARELALKVLFQLDVGKQPLDEVRDGALAQVRQTVDHPVSQLSHELRAELKEKIDAATPELSTQSLRQVRNVSRSLQAEMTSLMGELAMRAEELVRSPGEVSVEEAGRLARRDVDGSVERMLRLKQRETLQPKLVEAMVDAARARAVEAVDTFNKAAPAAHATAELLHTLIDGALDKRSEIDDRVSRLSEGWALDRQPAVDRNILRIAAFEIMFLPEIPSGPSINEAVELAKKYSTAESGRFVNGVLGALATAVGKGNQPDKSGDPSAGEDSNA